MNGIKITIEDYNGNKVELHTGYDDYKPRWSTSLGTEGSDDKLLPRRGSYPADAVDSRPLVEQARDILATVACWKM